MAGAVGADSARGRSRPRRSRFMLTDSVPPVYRYGREAPEGAPCLSRGQRPGRRPGYRLGLKCRAEPKREALKGAHQTTEKSGHMVFEEEESGRVWPSIGRSLKPPQRTQRDLNREAPSHAAARSVAILPIRGLALR
jgi:hypothetical protein